MERFKHTEQTTKLFNKVLDDYWRIQGDSELDKRGLSYTDYKNMGFMVDSLRFDGSLEIQDESIANYFGSLGCMVERIADRFRVNL